MIFASGLGRPEGPVLLPDRSWLIVERGPGLGCLTHIGADGRDRRILVKTGRPNALAVDGDGAIWVTESMNPPSLLRATMDGRVEVFVTGCGDEPFLWPNDLCFGLDGALYMTDSGIPAAEWARLGPEEQRTAPTDGRLYRIDVGDKTVLKLDSGLAFTNGIAFGPDRNLYVSTTLDGMVHRYRWRQGGVVGEREEFGNVTDPALPPAFRGPDGMAFGADGNLYVAVAWQGDVTVLGPDGAVARRMKMAGPSPSNVAFGSPGERKIYVTEQGLGQFEVHEVDTDGLPLYT
jgi:gluconolactonase